MLKGYDALCWWMLLVYIEGFGRRCCCARGQDLFRNQDLFGYVRQTTLGDRMEMARGAAPLKGYISGAAGYAAAGWGCWKRLSWSRCCKYSEIVWLRPALTASTRHDAMVITGLANTYAPGDPRDMVKAKLPEA
jgi:hypothetical protein